MIAGLCGVSAAVMDMWGMNPLPMVCCAYYTEGLCGKVREECVAADSSDTQKTPGELRAAARSGDFSGTTSGMAAGFVQCNLVIVPAEFAHDFADFCRRNPKPCPLLATSPSSGDTSLPELGKDIDVRTDLPRYRRWESGKLTAEPVDLCADWQEDHVAFALGCSFSFEEALLADGLEIRNITEKVNVPMYRTNQACHPAGPFWGNLVVSMRPMKPKDAIRAIQICTRFPSVHGAPVHFGDPSQIGIEDLSNPDFGDSVTIAEGEIPVFWACGVTPQVALENARLPLAFTHAPGHMLVTDKTNAGLALL